jgi:predicted cobalt transporter CbtA
MSDELAAVKAGLAIVLVGLFFSVALGISFGVNEDAFKNYVADGIAANPEVHDEKSKDKIWRYAQRTHFHAGGVAAFCLGLIILVMFSDLRPALRKASSILIGLGSFYPLAWLSMFFLAPSIGRNPAHEHFLTKLLTFVGVGGILLGSFFLLANLFLGFFKDPLKS